MSFYKNYEIIIYGFVLALLLFVMKWIEFKFLIINNAADVYIGIIALLFTVLGFWLALKLTQPKIKEIIIEKKVAVNDTYIDKDKIIKLGLSSRELEILEMIARGKSNQEISIALFISVSTVKSHTSNLFLKLDVKRRTQAIEVARVSNLIKPR